MPTQIADQLPPPVTLFFAARNARDFDTAVTAFSPSATVADEGGVHRGHDAIRAWMKATVEKYDDTAEVLGATRDGGATVVSARVSGTFPGSPAALRFAFTIGDEGIARLEIGG